MEKYGKQPFFMAATARFGIPPDLGYRQIGVYRVKRHVNIKHNK